MPVGANTHSLEATVSRFGANACLGGWLWSRRAIWLSGRTSGNLGAWLVNGRARSSCARQQSPSRNGKHQRDQEPSHRPLSLIVCECRSGMLYPSTARVNKISFLDFSSGEVLPFHQWSCRYDEEVSRDLPGSCVATYARIIFLTRASVRCACTKERLYRSIFSQNAAPTTILIGDCAVATAYSGRRYDRCFHRNGSTAARPGNRNFPRRQSLQRFKRKDCRRKISARSNRMSRLLAANGNRSQGI